MDDADLVDMRRGAILRSPETFRIWLRVVLQEVPQRELAREAGINHSTISRLVNSSRAPSLEVANALIDAARRLGERE